MSFFKTTLEEMDRRIDEWCAEVKRGARKTRYERFMASEDWQDIRAVMLDIYNHQCAECGATEDLHVHHLTYERFGGDERTTDFKVLCKPCHEKAHGRKF